MSAALRDFSFPASRGAPRQKGDSVCFPAAIDACADGRHGCEHHCISARGTYSCRCRAGYYLNQDRRSCTSKVPIPLPAPSLRSSFAPRSEESLSPSLRLLSGSSLMIL